MIVLHIFITSITIMFKITYSFEITDTAANVADVVFFKNSITTVIWHQDKNEYVTDFLKKFKGLISITPMTTAGNVTDILNDNSDYQQVVFFPSVPEELAILSLLYNNTVKPIACILVSTEEQNITEITKIAWRYDIVDIVIVSKIYKKVAMFTYFPYREGDCSNITPVNINTVEEVKQALTKKFSNFYQCSIKLTVINSFPELKINQNKNVTTFSEIDGFIFTMLLEQLNASAEVTSVITNDIFYNGSGSSVFDDVINKRSDILVPPLSYLHNRYQSTQVSHMVRSLQVYWLAPKLFVESPIGIILGPLYSNIAPFLLFSFVSFVIAIKRLKSYKLKKIKVQNNVIFNTFQIFLGQETKFETKSSLINSLFSLWIWFCIILRVVYQSDLTHGLTRKRQAIRFHNFDAARQMISDYGGPLLLRHFFIGEPFEKDFKNVTIKEIESYIKDISHGKKYLLAVGLSVLQETNANVQIIEKPYLKMILSFYMRPGWSASKNFNDILLRMIESGFLVKATKTYDELIIKNLPQDIYTVEPLDLDKVLPFFFGLIIFIFLCILIFIVEVIWYKFKTS